MNDQDRLLLVDSIEFVDHAVLSVDVDRSVCETLKLVKEGIGGDIFLNSGDVEYKNTTPEKEVCQKLGIKTQFVASMRNDVHSSKLIHKASDFKEKEKIDRRPWGDYKIIYEKNGIVIKEINVKPGCRTSLQKHLKRDEHWFIVEGDINDNGMPLGKAYFIQQGKLHRLGTKEGGTIIEIISGEYNEDDIVRLEDDYGRK
jgi:mannose-6-phosphate isomerase-like protein (cupin superfamily)